MIDMVVLMDLTRIHENDCSHDCHMKELLSDLFELPYYDEQIFDKMLRDHEGSCYDVYEHLYECHVRKITLELFSQMLTFL